MKINGVEMSEIEKAMTLLQSAGLDTSSTTMHLTELLGRKSASEHVFERVQTPIGPKTVIRDRATGKIIASQG